MKTLVIAGLLAAASASNTNTVNSAANAASATGTTAPAYMFLLRFPDGSIEVCPATSFSIGFPQVDVQVQSCAPDLVFGDQFGG